MPASCEYGMCPRPAGSSNAPYCSEIHKLFAERKELKEKLALVEKRIQVLQTPTQVQRGVQRSIDVANQ